MDKMNTLKKDSLLVALENHYGIVSHACQDVKISRTTYYNWYKNDKEFKESVDLLHNVVLDFAETALFELIKNGNVAATIFFLKTRGKSRGYSETGEVVNHVRMQPPNIRFVRRGTDDLLLIEP